MMESTRRIWKAVQELASDKEIKTPNRLNEAERSIKSPKKISNILNKDTDKTS